ncbi:hypothetical protein [Janthinobacterium lividum]|uniref:hypothetical protein n=1 Tax=Janthinobacterium lividum TaxID=29581 RepID=UPI001595EC26|nr:hypothetical protein [Janthinobacterium lividum]QKY11963.1 hypothetical protein G8765_29165 [Janthinobacterium lividum]
MRKTDCIIDFSVLFERVLGCWPESIDVGQLRVNGNHPDLYVVIGLGDMGDSIVEDLSIETDAVLVTSLCDALTSTIRSAALFCTEIRPALLRPDTVRENFEKRLHRAVKNPDLGWSDDDILLINRYFAVNAQ